MCELNIEALLVTKGENIRYLSGFTGGSDARLVVTDNEQYIVTDSRYEEQVNRECPDWTLLLEKPPDHEALMRLCQQYKRIGAEAHDLTYNQYVSIAEKLTGELVPLSNVVEKLRVIKDATELTYLRKAAAIGDEVFSDICGFIAVGKKEKQVANQIAFLLQEKGCEGLSFPVIAVSGEDAALPHGQPGERKLAPGDMLTMDFGGFYHGYAGDMTRTVVIGVPSQRLYDYYMRVLEAQQLGVAAVKAGTACAEVDRKVREYLDKYQLASYFKHSTGHGVGLEIHEEPAVSAHSKAVLQAGMVVTVEPGIYIPGWGGIRIEDTVIVRDDGCEIITHADKNLIRL